MQETGAYYGPKGPIVSSLACLQDGGSSPYSWRVQFVFAGSGQSYRVGNEGNKHKKFVSNGGALTVCTYEHPPKVVGNGNNSLDLANGN